MATTAGFLAFGSNLGDRCGAITEALRALDQLGFRRTRTSSFYLTEPVGGPPQDWFVNAVAAGETSLTADALLDASLEVEGRLGRTRSIRNGPRTIDIDLLLYGDVVRSSERLTLPHPRLHERRFVLVPLAEIAPELRHPRLGLTIAELLARCPDTSEVRLHAAAESAR